MEKPALKLAVSRYGREAERNPNTRSIQPFSMAGNLTKYTDALKAKACAFATFRCCTRTSFG
jgi:hypothetical protein